MRRSPCRQRHAIDRLPFVRLRWLSDAELAGHLGSAMQSKRSNVPVGVWIASEAAMLFCSRPAALPAFLFPNTKNLPRHAPIAHSCSRNVRG